VRLALFQPDIPQNVGAAMRLCACLDVTLDIIEPCAFPWKEHEFRRSGMDYVNHVALKKHVSWDEFYKAYHGRQRLLLMTTKSSTPYTQFSFKEDDILIAGQESAGVPETVHKAVDERLVIPMKDGLRSLNIVNASAMILGEALRQTKAL